MANSRSTPSRFSILTFINLPLAGNGILTMSDRLRYVEAIDTLRRVRTCANALPRAFPTPIQIDWQTKCLIAKLQEFGTNLNWALTDSP